MSSQMIEMIGYSASMLIVVSMLMTSVNKLRIVNSIGAGIFIAYALMIHSYPTAIMNFCLILINLYQLFHAKKEEAAVNTAQ